MPRHFLTLNDLSSTELRRLLTTAIDDKHRFKAGLTDPALAGQILAMIFEKSSTRTRLSFEAGMIQLGGQAIFLSSQDSQIGRGEPIADTARVLSGMVDAVMIRTFEHQVAETLAAESSIPVINALTDLYHPCQLLADVMTYMELRGNPQGRRVVWIGDGNNMCHSYINAARQFDFQLIIACPVGYAPQADIVAQAGNHVEILHDPMAAAQQADWIATDVWASMGQEDEQQQREQAFSDFEVNETIMRQAKSDAVFMHCLPAHRGEEVSASVIDGPQSVVWQEAENRLHAQKALLKLLCQR